MQGVALQLVCDTWILRRSLLDSPVVARGMQWTLDGLHLVGQIAAYDLTYKNLAYGRRTAEQQRK